MWSNLTQWIDPSGFAPHQAAQSGLWRSTAPLELVSSSKHFGEVRSKWVKQHYPTDNEESGNGGRMTHQAEIPAGRKARRLRVMGQRRLLERPDLPWQRELFQWIKITCKMDSWLLHFTASLLHFITFYFLILLGYYLITASLLHFTARLLLDYCSITAGLLHHFSSITANYCIVTAWFLQITSWLIIQVNA